MAEQFIWQEAGAGERAGWRPDLLYPGASFTASWWYGEWHETLGRAVQRYRVLDHAGGVVAYAQFITYRAAGMSYWYAPRGPVLQAERPGLADFIAQEVKRLVKAKRLVFARLDFEPYFARATKGRPAPKATYHGAYFQPRREWVLPLGAPLEQIHAGIHSKTRYAIRTAEKRGVTTHITPAGAPGWLEALPVFTRLMHETARRNNFHLHPDSYYQAIFASLAESQAGYLVTASYEDQTLAVALLVTYGRTAHYVFGASSAEHRPLSAPSLGQWAAIQEAKRQDLAEYNFGGVGEGWEDLTHFKERFGGQALVHGPLYDIIGRPLVYALYVGRKVLQSWV